MSLPDYTHLNPTNSEDITVFVRHLEAVHMHSQELQRTVSEIPQQHVQLVLNHMEALRVALEELHAAEEELRQQNEELVAARQMAETERQRYQELFEFAPDGYVVTDVYGTVRQANRAAGRLLTSGEFALAEDFQSPI